MLLFRMAPRLFSQAYCRAALCTIALLMTAGALRSQTGCQGRCINPHPGADFQSWDGQENGCLVQKWRRWTDGCTHYQWYDRCQNTWDNEPDGRPRVTWTCCVH